ncbi:hypothetical protein JS530_09465 [Bifidobacterium sp. LC6]|uniref:CTP synthase n=1 Tax=Bifidobacterium colobi TaxID=2809026 RepID=A0ABS5UYI2_9BIFI|nr:hypothetical protein [Bifidobacterium colobi]
MNTYRGSPSLYAEQRYWNTLTPPDQTLHIAKALAVAHPKWIFGGLVAASAYGFEHQWCLHDGSVSVMTQNHGSEQRHSQLRRVYMPQASSLAVHDSTSGLLLMPPAHTLIECARTYDFRFALPFFDSAFAKGVSTEQILTACSTLRTDCTPVFRLLQHTNPHSENGGESLMRGTIYEEQFVMPQIQVPVKDPQTGAAYRVDFVWRLNDGRIVVAEYDGTEKYVNPNMTDNRSIQQVVAKERERDAGLQRAGANEVVHLTFSEVYEKTPLRIKLLKAGIPLRGDGA